MPSQTNHHQVPLSLPPPPPPDANNNTEIPHGTRDHLKLSKVPKDSWLTTSSYPSVSKALSRGGNPVNVCPPFRNRCPVSLVTPSIPTFQPRQVDTRPKAKGVRRKKHSMEVFLQQMGVPQEEMKQIWDPAVAIRKARKNMKKSWDQYTLDEFEIGKPLGEGRYGHVYMARDVDMGIIVALKVLHMKQIQEDRQEETVEREVAIHSRLSHPNIIKMLGWFVDPVKDKLALVLEFAPGGDLFSLLQSQPKGRFSNHRSASYIQQVLEALTHLQTLNILHRDIKPENILVDYYGELKLSDFGWAIKRENPNVRRRTVCGTIDYMAPEILMEKPYDDKADLWGVGTLSYELLTGNVPFPGREQGVPYAPMTGQGQGTRPQFPSYVNEVAQDFIMKLLKQNPAARMTLKNAKRHPWMLEALEEYEKKLLPMFKGCENVDVKAMEAAYTQLAEASK